jgi:hypothetical protein
MYHVGAYAAESAPRAFEAFKARAFGPAANAQKIRKVSPNPD